MARLRAWCALPGAAVLFDEAGAALFDVQSAKALPLALVELTGVEEAKDSQTGQPYLRLSFGNGRQLALTAAGVAFAPATGNTGPLPELPTAVCLGDLSRLLDRLKHELYGHPEEAPSRDAARLVLWCLAVLEGARAIGFETGREEKELDAHLKELERRAGRADS